MTETAPGLWIIIFLDYMIGKRTAKHVERKRAGYIGTIAFYMICLNYLQMPRPIDVSDTQVDNLVGIGLGYCQTA